MIISTLKVYPGSEGRKDVLDIFRSLDWSLKETPGVLDSSYSTGRRGDSEYLVQIALWRSEADLARFIRSSLFNRLMTVMELSKAPPEIRFHDISHTRGMEYIESLRAVACE
jgi:heme-degrading monooxygenase HmoA